MSTGNNTSYNYTSTNASSQIKGSDGTLGGFFVTATTAGTITIYDNTVSGGTVILATAILPVGFYPLPISFNNGCYITLSNMTVTMLWL